MIESDFDLYRLNFYRAKSYRAYITNLDPKMLTHSFREHLSQYEEIVWKEPPASQLMSLDSRSGVKYRGLDFFFSFQNHPPYVRWHFSYSKRGFFILNLSAGETVDERYGHVANLLDIGNDTRLKWYFKVWREWHNKINRSRDLFVPIHSTSFIGGLAKRPDVRSNSNHFLKADIQENYHSFVAWLKSEKPYINGYGLGDMSLDLLMCHEDVEETSTSFILHIYGRLASRLKDDKIKRPPAKEIATIRVLHFSSQSKLQFMAWAYNHVAKVPLYEIFRAIISEFSNNVSSDDKQTKILYDGIIAGNKNFPVRSKIMSDQIDRKLLYEAFLEAFDRPDLERMLSFELGVSLNRIIGQGNLEDTVFGIIEHFGKRDRLLELVCVAHKARPNNTKLRQLATNCPPPPTTTTADPPQQSPQTTVYVGEGGVYVDGNVTGDITTGDNNTKR